MPIHHAVANGSEKLVMYLIEQDGLETNVTDSNGLTLLHVAAECGYASLLNYLIAFTEVDVNSKDGKADIKPFKLNMPSGKILPHKQIEIIEKETKRYMVAQKISNFAFF